MVKIFCWNVAGLRSLLKKGSLECLRGGNYDIVCFQETKTLPEEVTIPTWLNEIYPYKFWQSNYGLGDQKKGFSGTAIWSRYKGIQISPPEKDLEGRVTTVDFGTYILITIYCVNSQNNASLRLKYRTEVWDLLFRNYIKELKNIHSKPVIVCGDLNVCHQDIDIYEPKKYKNKIACFFDSERDNMQELLNIGLIDAYRYKYGNIENIYTYWNQRFPQMRITNRGFRIDYFLVDDLIKENIIDCQIYNTIFGSDHCPIVLEFNDNYKPILKENNLKESEQSELQNKITKKLVRKVKLKIINKIE